MHSGQLTKLSRKDSIQPRMDTDKPDTHGWKAMQRATSALRKDSSTWPPRYGRQLRRLTLAAPTLCDTPSPIISLLSHSPRALSSQDQNLPSAPSARQYFRDDRASCSSVRLRSRTSMVPVHESPR